MKNKSAFNLIPITNRPIFKLFSALFLISITTFSTSCEPRAICNPGNAGSDCGILQALGTPPASTTGTVPTVPSPPSGVSALPGNTQVTISWNSVTGATSYNIYWGTAAGVTKATGTSIANGSATSYIHNIANNTTYYYILTAVNSAGGESVASTEVSAMPFCDPCKMFVTAATFDGAITGGVGATGIARADNRCMVDANKPGTPAASVYKAMIVDNATPTPNRRACISASCPTGVSEHIDWVFHSNRNYARATDGLIIGGTVAWAGIFSPFNLNYAVTAAAVKHWTGIDTVSIWTSSATNCTNWTSTGGNGYSGDSNATAISFLSATSPVCNINFYLVCVEQ